DADDQEVIELHVTGSAGPRATVGDCGLAALELLNGGQESCPTYATIALKTVVIPKDGYVLICSKDSRIDAEKKCDVSVAADGRDLQNGWIQNGPRDGLRFRADDDTVTRALSYEDFNPSCFSSPDAPVMRAAEGVYGSALDDFTVACPNGFVTEFADLGIL